MCYKYSMKYILKTLVDITETGARFQNQETKWKQQQNYQTVLNTVGLRCNPHPLHSPEIMEVPGTSVGFGSRYRQTQRVWVWRFEIPYGDTDVELLKKDFHMVPVILGLSETASMDLPVFNTYDEKNTNIIFEKTL